MKKILIFSSTGGGGHTAVTNALVSYLRDEYKVTTKNIFSDVIEAYDPIKIFSFGFSNAESFYNKMLSKKKYHFLSFFYYFGNYYFNFFQSKISKKILHFLSHHKFDLVISDIPLVNGSILSACKQLDIPFLLIPTDLDIRTFIDNIYAPSHKRFRIALAFKDAETEQRLIEAKIPLSQSCITGFVIRPDFFIHKDQLIIKNQYNISSDKPVILLVLGAMGLESISHFVHELSYLKSKAHLIICTGKREDLKHKIQKISFPDHISYSVIGFTERISDLMAVSDLFITKSGSVSFCEGIYMNLPMILDATVKPLTWEQANHRFILRHDFGAVLEKYNDLCPLVDNLLFDKSKLQLYKQNLVLLNKKHAGYEIKRLINEMLNF